jgi:hypothetical protein
MKVLASISLLSLLFGSSVQAHKHGVRASERRERELRSEDTGGGPGTDGLVEDHECILYTNAAITGALQLALDKGYPSDCTTEASYLACGNTPADPGCCRYHTNKLVGDVDNDFFIQPVSI